ncbi:nodulation protein NfeD [Candidatus Dependentiae bacterium]|nr:nodulation protein NfeD [Candidatus Dependentiae bacterium]
MFHLKRLPVILFFILLLNLSIYSNEIFFIEVEGVINPVSSEFIRDSIKTAEEFNGECLIILLDTPGGLDENMREIIKAIMSSQIPIIVYVSPSGAQAASAGTYITMSAHIAAMSPGTNIGAATPVLIGQTSGKDTKVSPEMKKKMINNSIAYLKSLAEQRKRNSEWVVEAVKEGKSISSEEALSLNVIDIIAGNLDDLIIQINKKDVQLQVGERTIDTEGKKLKELKMNFKLNFLKTLANPNLAYLLFMAGLLGIYIEISNPGSIFPGVVGGLSLILALYAFNVLPVNTAGILLIILAFILFILEIRIISFGMLTIGGIVSLFLGSIFLMKSSVPFYSVSLWVIIPTTVFIALLVTLLISLGIKAQFKRVSTAGKGMVDEKGYIEQKLKKDLYLVHIHGELWKGESEEVLKIGDKVIVEDIDNLILKIKKV